MKNVFVDFQNIVGKMKPMHAVNNGPVYDADNLEQQIGNFEEYKALEIPFARNHDASFCAQYGGEHIVDIHLIYPDFDSDPYDESSYDFDLTDRYLKSTIAAGTKIFYRLGTKIEHTKKRYGTIPPKDFKKWAIICEHIIRHYNEGWNSGFNMNIEYWEIWNEPDGAPNWTGTPQQYYDLYNVASKHLKEQFPHLKIGGPALAFIDGKEWIDNFIDSIEVKPDFFSWHIYISDNVNYFAETAEYVRKLMDDKGWYDTELIINEWNYVKSFQTEEWKYSLKKMVSLKGASFVSAVMSVCQYSVLDMLMYYDARPCAMNGLFSPYRYELLKGYYVFKMFSNLYKLGNCVNFKSDDDDIFGCASTDGLKSAIMLTYYNDSDDLKQKKLKINIKDSIDAEEICVKIYYLSESEDMNLRYEQIMTSDRYNLILTINPHETIYIESVRG